MVYEVARAIHGTAVGPPLVTALRCVPRHYYFNGVEWYTNILEGMKPFKKVWLFQAPECPNSLGNDPARDGRCEVRRRGERRPRRAPRGAAVDNERSSAFTHVCAATPPAP